MFIIVAITFVCCFFQLAQIPESLVLRAILLLGAVVCSIFAIESLFLTLENAFRVYNSRSKNLEGYHADNNDGADKSIARWNNSSQNPL